MLVAVAADLVAAVRDGAHRVLVVLGHPGRDEERGADIVGSQQRQDARQGFHRPEPALRERDRLVNAAGHPQRLGVQIEGEGAGGAGVAGPVDGGGWIEGHRAASV